MTDGLLPGQSWQYCYVEKWADDSGVYERVTFDDAEKAQQYFADNAPIVADINVEGDPADDLVASIERRRVTTPGDWEPVLAPVHPNGSQHG